MSQPITRPQTTRPTVEFPSLVRIGRSFEAPAVQLVEVGCDQVALVLAALVRIESRHHEIGEVVGPPPFHHQLPVEQAAVPLGQQVRVPDVGIAVEQLNGRIDSALKSFFSTGIPRAPAPCS